MWFVYLFVLSLGCHGEVTWKQRFPLAVSPTLLSSIGLCVFFLLISGNVSDRNDLQTLQNNALRICYNVRLRDRVSVGNMHRNANLLSLEQRRQKQLLCLMFLYKTRHAEIRRIHGRNTRAADVFSFTRERYHNVKYRNSPFYKGALLWDTLPICVRQCLTVSDFKKSLKNIYSSYNDKLF